MDAITASIKEKNKMGASDIRLISGDCFDVMRSSLYNQTIEGKDVVIVTDPPFNIGYHYKNYKDRMKSEDYFHKLGGQ